MSDREWKNNKEGPPKNVNSHKYLYKASRGTKRGKRKGAKEIGSKDNNKSYEKFALSIPSLYKHFAHFVYYSEYAHINGNAPVSFVVFAVHTTHSHTQCISHTKKQNHFPIISFSVYNTQ